jgi:threonine/homoserine/homoserine lactone efflux protein
MHSTLLVFALVAFIGIATPGPTVLLAFTNGSRYGVPASIAGMVGAMVSDFVLISAVALGLGTLLAASELWFSAIKWVGVAYLAYLGVRLLRSKGSLATVPAVDSTTEPAPPSRSMFLRCFMVAVSNPKGYLFFSAFLPQFIVPTQPQLPQYLTLAAIFAAIDFVVMMAYSTAGAQTIRFLSVKKVQWLDRICGGALLALSGSLALYRRQA